MFNNFLIVPKILLPSKKCAYSKNIEISSQQPKKCNGVQVSKADCEAEQILTSGLNQCLVAEAEKSDATES